MGRISWLFYKRGGGFRDKREQIQLAVGEGLKLGDSELQVQRSSRSATLPPKNKSYEYQYITDSI